MMVVLLSRLSTPSQFTKVTKVHMTRASSSPTKMHHLLLERTLLNQSTPAECRIMQSSSNMKQPCFIIPMSTTKSIELAFSHLRWEMVKFWNDLINAKGKIVRYLTLTLATMPCNSQTSFTRWSKVVLAEYCMLSAVSLTFARFPAQELRISCQK